MSVTNQVQLLLLCAQVKARRSIKPPLFICSQRIFNNLPPTLVLASLLHLDTVLQLRRRSVLRLAGAAVSYRVCFSHLPML